MKALVIGNAGSIGKRHSENLHSLGVEVIGCELGEQANYKVDFAIIASPTQTHKMWIENLNFHGVPFLCEKPVAGHSRDAVSLEDLLITVPNMVACNIRFSESMSILKSFVEQNEVISFHARISDGSDSRAKYKEGIALQDIHEFDYLSYLLGPIEEITLCSNYDDDLYDAFVIMRSGIQGVVHGDKISQKYHRELTITSKKTTLTIPVVTSNNMYVKELEYFMDCIKNGHKPMNTVYEAIELTRMLCEEYEFA